MRPNLKEIARDEKVPYSTIAGWIGRGLVEPSHRTGRSGAVIVLDDKNVIELKNLIRLRKGGLPLQRARHLMEDLRAAGYNPLSQGIFIVLDRRRGRVLRISTDKKKARDVWGPHRGQYVMIELLPETHRAGDPTMTNRAKRARGWRLSRGAALRAFLSKGN